MKPADLLILQKKVRFCDFDSSGVIHFHNLLKLSHEAWEESIEIYGIPYQDIFPDFSIRKSQILFPIVNCEANFFAPIKIGDFLKVKISPNKINSHLFQVNSFFIKNENKVAEGKIIHCSLDVDSRNKIALPNQLERWIEASNVSTNLKEC